MHPIIRGRRFEQFVINQIAAAISYKKLDLQLFYWRTNHGAEVDILICRGEKVLAAVKIKASPDIVTESLSGLKSYLQEHPETPAYVLGHKQSTRLLRSNILVLNWAEFISDQLPAL